MLLFFSDPLRPSLCLCWRRKGSLTIRDGLLLVVLDIQGVGDVLALTVDTLGSGLEIDIGAREFRGRKRCREGCREGCRSRSRERCRSWSRISRGCRAEWWWWAAWREGRKGDGLVQKHQFSFSFSCIFTYNGVGGVGAVHVIPLVESSRGVIWVVVEPRSKIWAPATTLRMF